MSESTIVESVRNMTSKEIVIELIALRAEVEALKASSAAKPKAEPTEMTDDHARRIMSGDHRTTKHNEAATALGLSYGQVYSCRLGYTFKHIHKEMKDSSVANPWAK